MVSWGIPCDVQCTVRSVWCMVHGVRSAWCIVHGAWYMVHGTWCSCNVQFAMVHGAWCLIVYGAWYMVQLQCAVCYGAMVHGTWCSCHVQFAMVHGAWCMVHGACMVHVCRMHGAWCSCNVQFAMHTPSIAHMRQSMGTLFTYLCHLGIEMCVYDTHVYIHIHRSV